MACDPLKSSCCNQAQNEQVIASKAGGVFPSVSILVRPLESNIEQLAFCAFLLPNAGTDRAVADFVDWLITWRSG